MPIDKTKVKHFKSFKEAEEYEIEEMNKLSYQERLSILLNLRKQFYDVSGKLESRLQRFHKFSKRKRR